jgi:4-hydroxy-tetrahydrodipicolinate synthase
MMAQFAAACLDGRWEEARAWNSRLYPLMKINFVESSPIPVKAALAMMGKIHEVYRMPLVNISEGARAKVASVLSSLNLIRGDKGTTV